MATSSTAVRLVFAGVAKEDTRLWTIQLPKLAEVELSEVDLVANEPQKW